MPYRCIEGDEIDGPLRLTDVFELEIKTDNTFFLVAKCNHCNNKNVDGTFLNQNGNITSWDKDWSPHGLKHGLMTVSAVCSFKKIKNCTLYHLC
jgi:hypothetical protein